MSALETIQCDQVQSPSSGSEDSAVIPKTEAVSSTAVCPPPEIKMESIPAELRERTQWVLWRTEWRDGKPTKKPCSVKGGAGKTDDPQTWTSFTEAHAKYQAGGYDGVGFVFTVDDPYCGIDLDNCRDPQTGTIEPWAQEIIDQCASYAEVSPSKTGVKIFGAGKTPDGSRKRYELGDGKRIEVYSQGRYFTVTGEALDGAQQTLANIQPAIDATSHRYCVKSKVSQEVRIESLTPAVGLSTLDRARRSIEEMRPAISGLGGHDATFAVACEAFRFGLTEAEAHFLLTEYNRRCQPPWSEPELRHKLSASSDNVPMLLLKPADAASHLPSADTAMHSM